MARATTSSTPRGTPGGPSTIPTRSGALAERLARFLGTGRYLVVQTVIVVVWIALNIAAVSLRWDKYPFILLNLMFSTQAAYAAPLILLAQNRQADRDRAEIERDREANAAHARRHGVPRPRDRALRLALERKADREDLARAARAADGDLERLEARPPGPIDEPTPTERSRRSAASDRVGRGARPSRSDHRAALRPRRRAHPDRHRPRKAWKQTFDEFLRARRRRRASSRSTRRRLQRVRRRPAPRRRRAHLPESAGSTCPRASPDDPPTPRPSTGSATARTSWSSS